MVARSSTNGNNQERSCCKTKMKSEIARQPIKNIKTVATRRPARMPYTMSPFVWNSMTPGSIPWRTNAPSITAVEPSPGIPNVNIGTIVPPVVALLVTSGVTTPSGSPFPQLSGFFACRFIMPYASQVAPSAPTPGTAPTPVPMTLPTTTAFQRRNISPIDGRAMFLADEMISLRAPMSLRSLSTTAIPKNPVNAAAKGMPDDRSVMPNVYLLVASTGSRPTVDIRRPNRTPIKPFSVEPRTNDDTMSRPRTPTKAISAGPDCSATDASNGMKIIAMIQPNRPPSVDPIVA